MPEEKKDFEVKDRRIFSEQNREDESREEARSTESSPEAAEQASSPDEESRSTEAQKGPSATRAKQDPPLPEINFATFVVSMNASALMHLGAIEDPNTGQTSKNLAMAKQTIDILSMLQKKTEGNLTNEEKNLLKNILYDLRIIYVKEAG